MSDADWLQEAANLIGSVEVSEWSDDCYVPTPVARATADLLLVGAESPAAALALADVILGDNNE